MTSMAASSLINKAYLDSQRLAKYATLSAEQLTDGLDRLNDIINLWQTQGLKLFLESEQVVTLVQGQQMYSMRPGGDVNISRPLEIKEASYWDSSNNSLPLWPISRQEWTALTNRTVTGSVSQYFAEKLYDRLNLYLWNTPDVTAATGTVHAVLRLQATNPIVVSDAVLFPPEWAIALRWALASELAVGMPEPIAQRCDARSVAFREALEDWDVENAETYFQPDSRQLNMGGSRFR